MTASTSTKPSRTTHILKAVWGVIDDSALHVDVTRQVAALVRPNGAVVIKKVENESFGGGDPAPNKPKKLQVRYSSGQSGAIKTLTVAEGERFLIRGDPKGVVVPYASSRAHGVQPIEWESRDGVLLANGQRFHLKGVNYFGFETDIRMPHGLWQVPIRDVLSFVVREGFNAIRLPFSTAMALDLHKINTQWFVDEELRNLQCGELLGRVVDLCGEHGLLVMLDNHRLDEQHIPELWYDDCYSEADLLQAWDNVLDICKDKWNVFALDLKNEPHGEASWGLGCDKDWNRGAEIIANHIIANHPEFRGLFFIEGINDTSKMDCDDPCPHAAWWGGSFQGLHKAPIRLDPPEHDKRIVFSPHVYGPSVFMQDYFKDEAFPHNLPDIWRAQWAFAKDLTGRAVVLGEWGGWMDRPSEIDEVWQNALADFMIKEGFTDQFYWCLNPDSGDTGGLLQDDWKTPVQAKLDLLARVVPHPSKLVKDAQGSGYTVHTPTAN